MMTRLKLAKKLQPAKKAWKTFSNKLQSKVQKLNIPKLITTTLQRLLSTFESLIPSSRARRRSLTTTTTRPNYYATSTYYHVQRKNNFAAIRIDDLFAEPDSVSNSTHLANYKRSNHVAQAQGETSRSKLEDLECESSSSGVKNNTIEDAWKAVVAKSPQLQVDQKAEEFIYKFRQDMRLQKERSMLEFQEMLARSS